MKNLENYGVQEMNAKEIREVDGGSILGFLAVAFVVGVFIGLWRSAMTS